MKKLSYEYLLLRVKYLFYFDWHRNDSDEPNGYRWHVGTPLFALTRYKNSFDHIQGTYVTSLSVSFVQKLWPDEGDKLYRWEKGYQ